VHSGELVWSDETYKILGFARETNPTLDLVFDRVHPEDRDGLQQLRDRATQNGMDLDVEHRILLPDGVVKHVHVVAHAGRDNSWQPRICGVVTDITERKRAHDEREAPSRSLQESKARLEEAQSVAHVGYWDLETGEITWSDETYRIFGFKPQERPMDIETAPNDFGTWTFFGGMSDPIRESLFLVSSVSALHSCFSISVLRRC
jgi:PAS domain S-box-containing protein